MFLMPNCNTTLTEFLNAKIKIDDQNFINDNSIKAVAEKMFSTNSKEDDWKKCLSTVMTASTSYSTPIFTDEIKKYFKE